MIRAIIVDDEPLTLRSGAFQAGPSLAFRAAEEAGAA
jgi:hypothetical protein